MNIECQFCQTRFRVPHEKIPPAGTLVRCSSCKATFWVNAPSSSPETSSASSPPSTPAPSSLPQSNSDSWWDLPPIDEDAAESTAIQRNPLDQDSWLDLPNVKEQDESNDPFESMPASAKKSSPPASEPPPKTSVLPASFLDAQSDGPTKLSSNPFAEESNKKPGVQKRPVNLQMDSKKSMGSGESSPTTSSRVALSDDTGSPSMEFLLKDRIQQRQEFWYTTIPLFIRMCILLGFVVLFAWTWTSMDRGSFASTNLQWTPISQTFFGTHSPWKFRQLRFQWRRVNKKPLLIIRGELLHEKSKPQPQPKIIVRYFEGGQRKQSQPMRCCALAKAVHLQALRSPSRVKQWQKSPSTLRWKPMAPGKPHPFTLVWSPPQGIQRLVLHVLPTKAKPRRRPPVERDEFDDDDDDDDDD